jgi:hypothetical protein
MAGVFGVRHRAMMVSDTVGRGVCEAIRLRP